MLAATVWMHLLQFDRLCPKLHALGVQLLNGSTLARDTLVHVSQCQIRIDVRAAGLNFHDVVVGLGLISDEGLGAEAAGRISGAAIRGRCAGTVRGLPEAFVLILRTFIQFNLS